MATADWGASLQAINASDFTGFGVAISAQLQSWARDRQQAFQELVDAVQVLLGLSERITSVEMRVNESHDPDLSQDMGPSMQEQVQHIETAIEMRLSVHLLEMRNHIARNEIRIEQISTSGDHVVDNMRTWTDGALATFLQQKAELEHIVQQTQAKFQSLEANQLQSRDLDPVAGSRSGGTC